MYFWAASFIGGRDSISTCTKDQSWRIKWRVQFWCSAGAWQLLWFYATKTRLNLSRGKMEILCFTCEYYMRKAGGNDKGSEYNKIDRLEKVRYFSRISTNLVHGCVWYCSSATYIWRVIDSLSNPKYRTHKCRLAVNADQGNIDVSKCRKSRISPKA